MVVAGRLRAFWRMAGFALLTLGLLPFYLLAVACGETPKYLVQLLWCNLVLRLFGIRTCRRGSPFRANPTLFVANHVSYLDVLAVGRFARTTFIAKSEIAGWPLFGFLGRLAGTMFIRRYWLEALIQRNTLGRRLRAGESFVLFAEGTSSDGLDVLPFKTSLLSVAEPWVVDRPIAVQPVTLRYLQRDSGKPFTRADAGLFAWIGDSEFLPHLWQLMHQRGALLEVVFAEPVISWSVRSRKVLGRSLRSGIRATLVDYTTESAAFPAGSRAAIRQEQASAG